MIFASTQAAEVNHDRDNEKQQINASDRLPGIHHPSISEGRQG
jgi:hypothetical protein